MGILNESVVIGDIPRFSLHFAYLKFSLRHVYCHFASNSLPLTVVLHLTNYSFIATDKLGKVRNLLNVYVYVLCYSYNYKHDMGANYENCTDDIG